MLIEIPDPEIILGIVISFFVGLFVLYVFYKIKFNYKLFVVNIIIDIFYCITNNMVYILVMQIETLN